MKSLTLKALSIGLLMTASLSLQAEAEPTSMFILDASGSMWGRLPDSQMKIVAARDAMSELVGALPDNISTGLIAYGHRRKGDCGDIEVVQEATPGGGSKIADIIATLQPRGKTPISDALKLAGNKLTGIEDQTTIVLVSDGIETCEGNPCAVAEALAAAQVNLSIHVIGYSVDQLTRTQLQCVADKGNGEYFTADDLSGLKTALATVTESIRSAEPIAVPEPIIVAAPEAADTGSAITIQIAGPGTIRLDMADWTHAPKYWKILDPETGEEIAKTSENEASVMPGDYQLAWRHLEHGSAEVILPQIVTVESGKVTDAPIKTGLQLVPPAETETPYYWQLLPEGAKVKKSFRGRDAAAWYWVWDAVPVPAGAYTLLIRQSEHDHSEANLGRVVLEEGQLQQLPLDQGVNVAWNSVWGDEVYNITFTHENGDQIKTDTQGPLFLAPGKYDVSLRLTQHDHRDAPFGTVEVSDTGFADAMLTSGITFDTAIEGEFKLIATDL
ncbi:MAG: VWA domain-containing protein, partial [Hyphomicrobiales bacterium]